MDIQKEREAFENKFPVPAHWIDFDGLTCKYICKYNAIDDQALKYQARWESWLVAKAQAVPYESCSIKSHEIIINETKKELIDGYDFAQEDEYLLESLVYRGVCIGKAQAIPEGFVLVPKKPDVDKAWSIALKRIVPPPKTNDAIQKELMYKKYVDDLYSEQDRILLDYEAMIEAQEQSHDGY